MELVDVSNPKPKAFASPPCVARYAPVFWEPIAGTGERVAAPGGGVAFTAFAGRIVAGGSAANQGCQERGASQTPHDRRAQAARASRRG